MSVQQNADEMHHFERKTLISTQILQFGKQSCSCSLHLFTTCSVAVYRIERAAVQSVLLGVRPL